MKFLGFTITRKAVIAVAATALTRAVAAVAEAGNPIGDAAIAAVNAIESTTLTGAEKKAQVIATLVPVIKDEVAKGGLAAVVADVEQFAGMVVEEVVAQVKQTSLLTIATALLKLLGFK
ncbi:MULTISPECIES: hypothetical protein [unclassified Sphingomonas]|uniref:hypothetical protein n=1 Tax=unclassified Sphingomonas TaxID=196159 RepID=UPI00226A7087|nr:MULTISPECIES: hypothetical protein [unclassified Sphingomonas]